VTTSEPDSLFEPDLSRHLVTFIGYQIIDHFYIAVALDLPSSDFRNLVMKVPRRLTYSITNEYSGNVC
jgi:hypothetical protein